MAQEFNAFDNEHFRAEFTRILDAKLSPIIELIAADHKMVAAHEAKFQRQRGGLIVLGGLWVAIVACVDWLIQGLHLRQH